MNHGSLFSGIGGFDLAAEWMGWNNIFHCEWNDFGKRVLSYYWPNAISYHDITKTDFTIHRGQIDILTGGFPCQKFSVAGSKTGDDKLIIEMLRAIREIEPRWIVAENVGNILNKKFSSYLNLLVTSLEDQGYHTPLVFDCTADSVGLPTVERHIWFVAQANGQRQKRRIKEKVSKQPTFAWQLPRGHQGEFDRWQHAGSRVCELGQRVPGGLDTEAISKTKWHGESIQAIGNAINPQVALQIFKTIEAYENLNR